jgi:hypothetical protein
MRLLVFAVFLSAFVSLGQEPAPAQAASLPKPETAQTQPAQSPVLQNTGKPLRVPIECSDDDMQWAGMSCTEEEPCPVYLEVSGVEAVGNRIIVLGNIHTESITLYSEVLSSEDAGVTWHEAFERMRGVGLDHIQFIDFQNGWISGQTLVPVSHDPFLLITNDGGVSWRLRHVFSEGADGGIQQLWFESAKAGTLVIDRMQSADSARYELYETPNGGETWMIRRTSDRPLTIKRPAADAASSAWRIRADARSKSFAVEKRQAERWSTMASFSVEIGSCKPAPHAVSAPPPPEPAENGPTESPAPAPARPPSLKRPPKP